MTRDGNERAFEAIVQRYRRPLLRYCSRLLSSSRAEDAVQHAFLSAHRAIHAGDAELNLRPWLYRIAHNASLNLLRQHGYDHDEVSEEIDGVETPPQAFERGERLRTVVAAVQELPERQRSAIVLQAVEGRSYDEIADELGVTDGAVRQLLNRARNTLREAAAALTPTGLLARIGATAADAPVAERVAQTVAGAGGGALLAKAGATLVLAGAVAGGAATGALPGTGGSANKHEAASAAALAGTPGGAQSGGAGPQGNVVLTGRRSASGVQPPGSPGGGAHRGLAGGLAGGGSRSSGGGDHHGGGTSGDGHSGSGDSSGSGSGDHSGSGDSSGSGDHSGSSDGGGSSGSSGPSGSSSDGGSSGSGSSDGGDHGLSSGSGTSGSGTSGSGTSGSGTSGSGTSGSGSDDVTTTASDRSGSSGSSDSLDTSDDPSGTSGH